MVTERITKLPYLRVEMFNGDHSIRQQSIATRSVDLLTLGKKYGYLPESLAVISRALHIASSHEFNKQLDRRSRKFDKEPYIFHPLAMAQEAMRMRQDPMIVAACLMHDVPEDVELGALHSSEDWMNHIESVFTKHKDCDRLMRILRAELKTESLSQMERKDKVVDFYTNTSLGKTALKYLKQLRGSGSEPTERDQEHITEVLYDLNRMMSDSYIVKGDGGKEFDPSILVVKILDTWQNLQTPGFWKTQLTTPDKDAKTIAKLLRARILTNIAEFLGMRKVASEMTQAIAAIHDLNDVNFPLLKILETGTNREDTGLENRRKEIATRMRNANGLIPNLRQMLHLSDHENIEAVLQMPWAAAQQDADTFTSTTGQVMYFIRGNDNRERTSLQTSLNLDHSIDSKPLSDAQAIRALMYRQMGRQVHDYALRDKVNDNIIARVRAEAPSARYISTTKYPSFNPPSPNAVPERRLFHPDVCKYTTKSKEEPQVPDALRNIDTRLVRFLEFMLSPETFLTHTNGPEDRPYVIVINGKVHLATNQTDVTVWDMAHAEGLKYPHVRYASAPESSAVAVGRNDEHVLDNMVLENNLLVRIMVVEDKKAEKRIEKQTGKVFPA